METNNSTLIIGPPDSGKTTFQAQLYARIQSNLGKIKLVRTPENISGIQRAYERLAAGQETETTPANENVEVTIPVILDDEEFDLVCKDYGGEQVKNITDLMEYDQNWIMRAKSNDRWILFIRPGEVYSDYDLSVAGFAEKENNPDRGNIEKDELSDQYHFIELLQALLHAREQGIKAEIDCPKLLIVLTCWDELNTDSSPVEVLQYKMPLFHNFVRTIWKEGSSKVIGLSAQEFALNNPKAIEKYITELPESFGYLVLENNPKEKDLTKLIEVALKL